MAENQQPEEIKPVSKTDNQVNNATPAKDNGEVIVFGVGASAGGLEALQELLSHLPPDLSNIAVVIAQHLSPTYKSMLVQLLSRATTRPVVEVENGINVESDNIYITPPDREISLNNGKLILHRTVSSAGPKPSVDTFFYSLAEELGDKAVACILSGTGSDGASGIKKIKDAGGLTIAQEPQTAKYDGMPLAAIQTGMVDLVLSPEKIGEEVRDYLKRGGYLVFPVEYNTKHKDSLKKLLRLLSERTGTDFSNYKPSTICRRLDKRIIRANVNSIDEYLELIESNPQELDELFNTILIGVTRFFRDQDAYKALEQYLRRIIEHKAPGEAIRIWVPGCATGEEPHSIAILLHQLLGERQKAFHVQIFATDIDNNAISIGRRGLYPASALENADQKIINTYFIRKGDEYEVDKNIRQMVLFSKHDLSVHPPFLKLDMISCRNLLIYFGNDLQKHVIPIFHYSLNPEGFLFLGKSETVGQFSTLFTTLDGKHKIFQRKSSSGYQALRFSSFKPSITQPKAPQRREEEFGVKEMVMQTLYNTFEHPYCVVNSSMDIMEIFGDVSKFLSLQQGTMNASIINLANSDLQIELRSALTRAIRERTSARSDIRKLSRDNEIIFVRIAVRPVLYTQQKNELFLVIFETIEVDGKLLVTSEIDAEDKENLRIQELEQELNSTKEHLQTYIEELETANEELQSLNEELQSSNEELQSSNEELETSNEELQSSNEEIQIAYAELRSINQELAAKEEALNISQQNLQALLNNTLQAFILVNTNFEVILFNNAASEFAKKMFGKVIRLGNTMVDIIPYRTRGQFHEDFQSALGGNIVHAESTLTDTKGAQHHYIVNLTPVVTEGDTVEVISLSILDATELHEVKEALDKSEKLVASVFESADIGICVTDENGDFVKVNKGYCELYGYKSEELIGNSFTMVVPPEDRKVAQEVYKRTIAGEPEPNGEWKVMRKDGAIIDIFITTTLLVQEDGSKHKITTVRDITESKRYRNLLEDTQEAVKVGGWELDLINHALSWTEEVYHIHEIEDTSREISLDEGFQFYHSEARPVIREAVDAAITKGEPYDLELQLITAKNQLKWIRATCKPIRVYDKTVKLFGTIQDITAKKESEQEIQKLSLVASRTHNAVLVTNFEGKIEWVNTGFKKLFGYNEEEVKGKVFRELLFTENTDERVIQQIDTTLSNQSFLSVELLSRKKNTAPFWLIVEFTPIVNSQGKISNYIIIGADITHRKQSETELRIAKDQAEEISRLKSNFLANMSHELKTPLVGILGYAEIMQNRKQKVSLDKVAERINESGQRLLETLNLILDLSRIETNKMEIVYTHFSLDQAINSLVSIFKPHAEKKNLYLKTDIRVKEPVIYLDERLFRQIVSNLLNNALKFTKEGGVTIRVDTREVQGKEQFAISVQDTGIGIAQVHHDVIFQEFRQASEGRSRSFEGMGLGLTIARRITQLLGGSIELESSESSGSTFTVFFPLAEVSKTDTQEMEADVAPAKLNEEQIESIRGKQILLVENDEFHSDITKMFFGNLCDVDVAEDGETAVEMVSEKKYSLILMDINLGVGMNGIEAASIIRQLPDYKDVPIIAVTAFASRSDKEELLTQGFDHFLGKPFRRNSLLKTIADILEGHTK